MKHFTMTSRIAVLVALALLALASSALAQSGGPYTLSWSTVDGGGGTSTGGPYALAGTIGQPDAGPLAGGNYTLSGGFWSGGVAAPGQSVYLPLVLRN
jgi:hypothetical protein